METLYREWRGFRWSYWTYSDGLRVQVSAAWATKEIARGARVINVQ